MVQGGKEIKDGETVTIDGKEYIFDTSAENECRGCMVRYRDELCNILADCMVLPDCESGGDREDKMSKIYTIKAKMSGTGTIHDIASDTHNRDIVFAPGCQYAVVLAAYYGGKGYTTHKTEATTIAQANRLYNYSYEIIDAEGNRYGIVCGYWTSRLVRM